MWQRAERVVASDLSPWDTAQAHASPGCPEDEVLSWDCSQQIAGRTSVRLITLLCTVEVQAMAVSSREVAGCGALGPPPWV